MWRWIFAINLPLGVIAILLTRRGVREDTHRPGDPIDKRGAAMGTVGLGALAWALTHAETEFATRSALAAVAGVAILAVFLWHERRTRGAMMPLTLFESPTFSAANSVTFALYFGLSAILFFLPMLVISTWHVSELEAACAFAPMSAFIFLMSKRFGRLAEHIGPGIVVSLGSLTAAVAYFWLGFAVETQRFWLGVLPPMALMGLGMSMVVTPVSSSIMASVRDDQTGVASGVNNAISRIAGLIAVAAMSSVVSIVYEAAGGGASYGIGSDAPQHELASIAAFSAVAWVSAGLSALSAVLAILFIRQPRH